LRHKYTLFLTAIQDKFTYLEIFAKCSALGCFGSVNIFNILAAASLAREYLS
jgi:hypothetical protein